MSSLLFLMDVAAFVAVAWWILPRAGPNADASNSGWLGMEGDGRRETRPAGRRPIWAGDAAIDREPQQLSPPPGPSAPRWKEPPARRKAAR